MICFTSSDEATCYGCGRGSWLSSSLALGPALPALFKPYLRPMVAVTADLRARESLSFHQNGKFREGFPGVIPQIRGHCEIRWNLF